MEVASCSDRELFNDSIFGEFRFIASFEVPRDHRCRLSSGVFIALTFRLIKKHFDAFTSWNLSEKEPRSALDYDIKNETSLQK